ncbi:MAG: TadE family protein [Sphingomonadales bacterium]
MRDRTGASAFEFALVLPVFLVMMLGTMQYGVLFYTWNMALYGARNAARAVAVSSTNVSGGQTMMVNAMPPWVTSRAGTGDVVASITDAAVGGDVVATLKVPAKWATVLNIAPMPTTLSVTVRMVKEA